MSVDIPKTSKPRPQRSGPQIIAVASGKGGVGKTLACFGISWYLAKVGYRTIGVDLDFGTGNLHLSAGLGRVETSLDHFFAGQIQNLNDLSIAVPGNAKLTILTAGGRHSSATGIPGHKKRALLEQLPTLDADIVLLDIGAGSSQDNIDYFLAADHHIAIATADLSSMTALTAFLKKAYIHTVLRLLSSENPKLNALGEREYTYAGELFLAIEEYSDENTSRTIMQQAANGFRPTVLLNRMGDGDLVQIDRFNKNLTRSFNSATRVLGTIPEDETVARCRRRGQNFLLHNPASAVARALAAITGLWRETHCDQLIDDEPWEPD